MSDRNPNAPLLAEDYLREAPQLPPEGALLARFVGGARKFNRTSFDETCVEQNIAIDLIVIDTEGQRYPMTERMRVSIYRQQAPDDGYPSSNLFLLLDGVLGGATRGRFAQVRIEHETTNGRTRAKIVQWGAATEKQAAAVREIVPDAEADAYETPERDDEFTDRLARAAAELEDKLREIGRGKKKRAAKKRAAPRPAPQDDAPPPPAETPEPREPNGKSDDDDDIPF